MDKTAIQAIQESSAAAAKQVQDVPGLPSHVLAIPRSVTLESTKAYLPGRTRFRGRLLTKSISDFVKFTKDNGSTPKPQTFVDGDAMSATSFFNLGNEEKPGHGDFTATLTLEKTPAFAALLSEEGSPMSQKDLTDFIEDWANTLTAWKEGEGGTVEPIRLTQAVAAIRKITIDERSKTETQQNHFKHAQSTLDSVEARSDEGLPDLLTFTTEPYRGLASRDFQLRLSIRTGGREPALVFRIVGKDQHLEEIAEEFKALLIRELEESATVTIGTFKP